MVVTPLIESTPEQKLEEMIRNMSLSEPFNRYALFKTDYSWDEDLIDRFTNKEQYFLCVYNIGYDPTPLLELAKAKGFMILDDYVLDPQTSYISIKTVGVIRYRGV